MASRYGRIVRWREPGTQRESYKALPTEQRAREFLDDRLREADLVRDGYISAKQVEVATGRTAMLVDILREYNADREYRRVGASEIASSTALIEFVFDKCRWVRVSDVDPVRLKTAMRKLAKDRNWSARTVNRYSEVLRGLFRHVVETGAIAENPCSILDTLDAGRDRRRISRALTVAESDALINAALDPRRRLFYMLRLRTGLRIREAVRLEWSDIDDREVRLRAAATKNGKPDVLPISADLALEITDYRRYSIRQGRIFTSVPDPRTWKRDLARAGVEYKARGEQADPKCARKTFESHLLRSGCDIAVVMLLMRHTPRGGMALTLGPYADLQELQDRKRAAITAMTAWQEQERKAAKSKIG